MRKRNGIWKKSFVMVMILAMVMSLCGCIRYRLTSTVHEDGSVDVTLFYAMLDTSSFGEDETMTSEDMLTAEQRQALEKAGWTCEDYTGEPGDEIAYIGYKISKSGIAFEDLQAELTSENVGVKGFTCTKDGEVYIMNWDVSSEQSDASGSGVDNSMLEEYGGYMEVQVELPNGALFENSTSKEGNTYTWKIMSMKEPIHVEYTLDGTTPDGYAPAPTTETTETTTETTTSDTEETTEPTTEETTAPTTEVTTVETTEMTTEETTEETEESTKKTKKTKATDEDDEDEEEPSEKSKKNKKSSKKEEEKSFPIWGVIAIAGGVIVVAAAIVTVVVVKRKNTQS